MLNKESPGCQANMAGIATSLMTKFPCTEWIIDSGATHHIADLQLERIGSDSPNESAKPSYHDAHTTFDTGGNREAVEGNAHVEQDLSAVAEDSDVEGNAHVEQDLSAVAEDSNVDMPETGVAELGSDTAKLLTPIQQQSTMSNDVILPPVVELENNEVRDMDPHIHCPTTYLIQS
ncbi:hypothetical protein A4A49_28333 [Nicotiana attenuata]|uniref:Uncharacterized protein n=1 Tax=Nicotiana attenuata TaxID=49451 RepID=A0A1J6KZQ3_NICAT|nr:hypothetical protein A4A49_28333 [Nicotiana attenuata]